MPRSSWCWLAAAQAALGVLGAPGPRALAGNLVVILATDDRAPRIGPDMEENSRLMTGLVERNVPANRARNLKLNPAAFRAETALRLIALAPVGPDDAVLFSNGGHGAFDPAGRQTYLTLSGDRGRVALFVGQIRRAIEARGVRFVAVVLDCRNSLRPVRGKRAASVPREMPPRSWGNGLPFQRTPSGLRPGHPVAPAPGPPLPWPPTPDPWPLLLAPGRLPSVAVN